MYEKKPDELFRNVPANIHELRLALFGLPQDMKVLAESETAFRKTLLRSYGPGQPGRQGR